MRFTLPITVPLTGRCMPRFGRHSVPRALRRAGLRVLASALLVLFAASAVQAVDVDPKLKDYAKSKGVSGNVNSIGSDTLNNLMALWAETFRKLYPNVNIQVEGKGSSTAPPALIEGTAQLGPMSRHMKSNEIEAFERKYGYQPTPVIVAIDTLAVFVHKDNPIKELSLPQVDAIFSRNRKGGFARDLTTWGQLGLTGAWQNLPISLYGRNSASGTYGYFKDHALFKGDFKDRVKEQPGSASVVQGVGADRGAIGYSGIGYATSGVRIVPLAKNPGDKAYAPDYANALSGKYLLARPLLIYVNKHPTKGIDKLTTEFLRLVLSRQGQQVVVRDGYLPLPASVVAQELGKF